jgi:hypothetical protein
MLGFACWLAILMAAGLCYPRKPRASGALFLLLAVWSVFLQILSSPAGSVLRAVWFPACWFALGLSYLIRFRDPQVRAKHVAHWTAKV